jgi:hypothetical protein
MAQISASAAADAPQAGADGAAPRTCAGQRCPHIRPASRIGLAAALARPYQPIAPHCQANVGRPAFMGVGAARAHPPIAFAWFLPFEGAGRIPGPRAARADDGPQHAVFDIAGGAGSGLRHPNTDDGRTVGRSHVVPGRRNRGRGHAVIPRFGWRRRGFRRGSGRQSVDQKRDRVDDVRRFDRQRTVKSRAQIDLPRRDRARRRRPFVAAAAQDDRREGQERAGRDQCPPRHGARRQSRCKLSCRTRCLTQPLRQTCQCRQRRRGQRDENCLERPRRVAGLHGGPGPSGAFDQWRCSQCRNQPRCMGENRDRPGAEAVAVFPQPQDMTDAAEPFMRLGRRAESSNVGGRAVGQNRIENPFGSNPPWSRRHGSARARPGQMSTAFNGWRTRRDPDRQGAT